jgi:DNA polymerase III subunit epsilon
MGNGRMNVPQRSIVIDTETTGLDPNGGHRVIEVACVELIRDLPSGATFHVLIDPERDVPEDATRIHGYTRAHLHGKPRFAEVIDKLLAFIGDAPLIAHNAPFDFGFLNAELARLSLAALDPGRMIDTLVLAKGRFPGLPNSLDALCRRYGIDLSERTSHNALLDCRLLSDVYVELTGGRQPMLLPEDEGIVLPAVSYQPVGRRTPVLLQVGADALARHAAFVARLRDPVWLTA